MRADSIVLQTIKEHELIQEGDRLVLGLSGGPDSLCLLDILAKLQPRLKFKLYAVHVNHKIRGEDADADMNAVIEMCKDLLVPITVKVADVPAMAKEAGIGEEEAGRKVRYATLEAKAKQLRNDNPGCNVKIVVAHNKDDQAETVLMRILRGTGVHGLSAMEYKREDGLIRPLLDVARADIEDYCSQNGLEPRIDSTNQDLQIMRNRLRLRLIPVLEREFNPNLKDGLVRLAESAREDDSYIYSEARTFLPKVSQASDWDSMPRTQLVNMNPAVAKRVIKLMFERAGMTQDFTAVHINNLLEAAKKGGPATIEFADGYKAILEYDNVYFKGPKSKPVEPPKRWIVTCKVIPIEELPPIRSLGKYACALDALKVLAQESDVYVRTRRSGDKIRPLGMSGSKKLSDYFSDRKVPQEKRDSIKLLCCRHQVLWVEGYTVSDLCKVDGDTDFVLVTRIQEE